MKIPKAEFRAIVKEALQELISEGALDHLVHGTLMTERPHLYAQHQPQQQGMMLHDPAMRAAAMQAAGGDPQQFAVMEQVFADTAMNSVPFHMRNDPSPGMMGGQGGGGYYPQQQQMPPAYAPQYRNPLPPLQQQPAPSGPPQGPGPGGAPQNRWAHLAFQSPISNRPQSGGGSSGGFLPGSKKGKFE